MILDPLLHTLREGPHPAAGAPLSELLPVLRSLAPRLTVPASIEVPYGRYLLHAQPEFNVQLDVFSRSYRGGVHRHGTWGIFGLLRGALEVEDYDADGRTLLRLSHVPAGGVMAFASASDWHRVSTGAGEQGVSVHIYGPGFDLETGEAIDEAGVHRRYTRSAFGDLAALGALLAG